MIHAVGPIYSGPGDAPVLAAAYTASLRCADTVEARSIAFPSISTGAFGYPRRDAADVSVRALLGAATEVEECLLVAFDPKTERLWQQALDRELGS